MSDADDPTTIGKLPVAPLAASRLALLVMGPAATATYPVPDRGTLVIGRAQDCDVVVDDARLSRRHAALRAGERIELTDLGSTNGTILHDERLTANVPVAVAIGDSITIGSTILVLQRTARGPRPRHVWNHGFFEARVEEECLHAAQPGAAPFAVLRLRLPAQDLRATRSDDELNDILWAWLRDTDVVAKYAPNEIEVLLLGTKPDEADGRGADLTTKLLAAKLTVVLAVAAYPRDGRTPEALMERLTRALAATEGADRGSAQIVAVGAIDRMGRLVERVAASVINVLVLGETGVGKDVLARRIHALSPRAKMPFVAINCAALSESLLESELFGHEKGAFTGALAAKQGLLESANGGTVFLDEVGEMPLGLQAKLLRVLEEREVTRVGALRPRPIDVRFVAATNRDLEAEAAAGRFRQDLYFRLNGIALSLPPLRERIDEIEPLARAFVVQACRSLGRPAALSIEPEAMQLLKQYQWPGNIRELRNMIERAVLLCGGTAITKDHLPTEKMGPILTHSDRPPSVPVGGPAQTGHTGHTRPRATLRATEPPYRDRAPTLPVRAAAWDADTEAGTDIRLPAVDDALRLRIVEALEKCGGNQSHAAKMLGISRGTLIKRIEDLGLPRPRKHD